MNIENNILPFLGRTVKFMELYIEEEFERAGIPLTKLQFVFIMIISSNNGKSQNCLAELTGRDKTTFTRNLNTLEKKGLVHRKPSKEDKRIKLIYITDMGLELVRKSEPIMKQILLDVEDGISEEERNSFKLTLDKIKTKIITLRELQSQ